MRLFAVTFSFFCIYFLQTAEARAHVLSVSDGAQVLNANIFVSQHAGSSVEGKTFSLPFVAQEIFIFQPAIGSITQSVKRFTFLNAKMFSIHTGLSPPNIPAI